MKKFFQINVYWIMAFVLFVSFAIPQTTLGKSKSEQIHLHIQSGELNKNAKVTLIYKEKDKEKQISFSRQNSSLYKASKPSGFEATKDVTFKVKEDDETDSYNPTKVTGSKGTINYWIDLSDSEDGTEDDKDEYSTFTLNKPIFPLVKDVYDNGDGTFTAYWGYQNENDVTIDALDSRLISAYVYKGDAPILKGFAEGKVEEAFKTIFVGPSISWELTGPDKVKRTSTAYASNAKSYKSVQPLVKAVYNNQNGSYTAYWSYHNENNVKVDSKVSQFTTPALNNLQPMKTNFLPGFVHEAFKTNFNGLTLSWNLEGLNGTSHTAIAESRFAKNYVELFPTVKAVYDNGNGTFTAYWGYQNRNDVTVDAKESKFISGDVDIKSQPMKNDFIAGTNQEAFSTIFKGTHLIWEITGPDGQKKIVTAYSSNAPKYSALIPTLSKVYNNGDGTFTAVWGYQNQNIVEVNAGSSNFKGLVLKNEVAKKDQFKPGVQTNVFETTFKGTEISWFLTGPDGISRTVTAYSKDAVAR
ncbi:hypothetical protein ACFSO7_06970 [Bacillus sp. CGMCC 1.16607]|uniref:hypothetical protein n=1 Tax=Bacillus sp. CGMCC 1.16607 TaxID=3351842 RepID=UPI003633206A